MKTEKSMSAHCRNDCRTPFRPVCEPPSGYPVAANPKANSLPMMRLDEYRARSAIIPPTRMTKTRDETRRIIPMACVICLAAMPVACQADLKGDFADPPLKFRSRPLWFWNNTEVTAGGVETQLQGARNQSGYGGLAPADLCWKNEFRSFVDEWRGLGVYQSHDGIRCVSDSSILNRTAGRRQYHDQNPVTQSLRLWRRRVVQTQDPRFARNPLRIDKVSHHEKHAQIG